MLTPDTSLTGIAVVEAILREDLAAAWLLIHGTEPDDLPALCLFAFGGLAKELHDHHGAAAMLATSRRLVLEHWQPPPEQ